MFTKGLIKKFGKERLPDVEILYRAERETRLIGSGKECLLCITGFYADRYTGREALSDFGRKLTAKMLGSRFIEDVGYNLNMKKGRNRMDEFLSILNGLLTGVHDYATNEELILEDFGDSVSGDDSVQGN